MSDVELAVVPVAGDMTDAMTLPQESVEEGFKIRDKSRGYGVSDKTYATRAEAEKARLLKMASTGGDWEVIKEAEERDYICVHAKKGKYECSGTSSYAAAKKAAEHWGLKSTAGIDAYLADKEKTATESITEERLGYSDLSSEDQSRVDLKCRQNPDWDSMDAGEKDKYRYKVAKEMGLVESKIEEGRNDGPMSECCDAPLDGFENGLGRCSDCGEMAGAWNADDLDESKLDELDLQALARQGAQQAGIAYKGPAAKPLPKRTSQADRDAAIAAAPGVPAGTKGTSLDAWKGGKIPANIANNPTYKSEPGKAWIKQQQAAAKKHFGEEQVAEEDVIGDIIGKLEKMGIKGKTPQKPRTSMPLPKPKPAEPIGSDPETGATKGLPPEEVYSPQQLQQIANQNRITKPALKKESKFADWSKK
jgi:hypothetical protein